MIIPILHRKGDFNPRSPCGERLPAVSGWRLSPDFNPRSPCGERRGYPGRPPGYRDFNPRSPCGERPWLPASPSSGRYFNPRSPCGERPGRRLFLTSITERFQSTLPLRGATCSVWCEHGAAADFNPRSPCGERRADFFCRCYRHPISIHAPLAGSDWWSPGTSSPRRISIHAPLAGSDHNGFPVPSGNQISIHAPLAGSDPGLLGGQEPGQHFNPRSPCGERLGLVLIEGDAS